MQPTTEPVQVSDTARDFAKQEFGRRLQSAMNGKGWSQSELARRAALYMADKRFGRDLVSGYLRGRNLPGSTHLNALCRALGVKPDDLVPVEARGTSGVPVPVRTTAVDDNRVLLQINQIVDWPLALKILALLKGDPHSA